ncbi:hypothetical protein [Bacillus sp. FJAT-27245]|uniref:hypothetical protein n=1 Tax=Bacillus sp. FJAT-27245 TaxID=1684144 RepID=UPI000AED3D63|nr:hypothetical protein [Bacillus sp. FJAT-27245]
MNLTRLHNRSMMTNREIDYFANLGEILGFDSFVEDSEFDKSKNHSRPMDLAWWKWDLRENKEYYDHLALHLERENSSNKDIDTIDKLFSETEKDSRTTGSCVGRYELWSFFKKNESYVA